MRQPPDNELDTWRRAARALLAEETPPARAGWDAYDTLPLEQEPLDSEKKTSHVVSRKFLTLAERVLCHSDPGRHSLLYQAIWRLTHGEPHLFEMAHDPLVRRLELYDRAVRRDIHKTHAFVRFQPLMAADGTRTFIAWFEPRYSIVRLVGQFFVERFTSMQWTLMTPVGCAAWDGKALRYSGGIDKPLIDAHDPVIEAWKIYYRSIFNPARLHLQAMRREMPQFYWKNLPEAAQIRQLIENAGPRVDAMLHEPPAPRRRAVACASAGDRSKLETKQVLLSSGGSDLRSCRLCPHAAAATQAVAGEGPEHAAIMLVGEQPGDVEDLQGRPFVGPAGRVLDRALEAAGLDRRELYLTNAVKHFDWQLRGKRRLHKTPSQKAIDACRSHLIKELERVQPKVIVCLGRTAALSLTQGTGIEPERGIPLRLPNERFLLQTLHPAYILRSGNDAKEAFAELAAHLTEARRLAA